MQCPPTPQEDTPINGLPPLRGIHHVNIHPLPGQATHPLSSVHQALSFANKEYHNAVTAFHDALTVNQRFATAEAGWINQINGLTEENDRLEKAKAGLETELKNEKQELGAANVLVGAQCLTLREDLEAIRAELQTRIGEVDALRTAHETCDQTTKDLTTQLETKVRELETALTSHTTSEQTGNDLFAELETRRGDLKPAFATCETLEQTTITLRDELETKKGDLEAALRDRKNFQDTAKELGHQLEKTNDALTTALTAHEEAQQEIQDIRGDLKKSKSDNEQTLQKAGEEKRSALLKLQIDFNEQMERLESGRREEMLERQTLQRQLIAERWCRQQNHKKLRLLRSTLANMGAVGRAASLRMKLQDQIASEDDQTRRELLVCQSYVMDVVHKQAQSKQKLKVAQAGRYLAHSIARDLEHQDKRQREQILVSRNHDLESELGTLRTKTAARQIQIARLERGILAMMDDGEERHKAEAVLKALDNTLSDEECTKLVAAMTNDSKVLSKNEVSVVGSSSKRPRNDESLDEACEPDAKKAKTDRASSSMSSRQSGGDIHTDKRTEIIAVPTGDAVRVSSCREQDAVLGAIDESCQHTMPDEVDKDAVEDVSPQRHEPGPTQFSASDASVGFIACELNSSQQPAVRKGAKDLSAAHDLETAKNTSSTTEQCLASFATVSPSSQRKMTGNAHHSTSQTDNFSTEQPPGSAIRCSPTPPPPPPPPPAPPRTSLALAPPASTSKLPPPEYDTPPLPPPPEEIPRWKQKRVSFYEPLTPAGDTITAESHKSYSPINRPSPSRSGTASSRSSEESVKKPKGAAIKFALPAPSSSTNTKLTARTPSRPEARHTPIQPLKDRERQQKRLAQSSSAVREAPDPALQLPAKPSTPTNFYGRRESTARPSNANLGSRPDSGRTDDSDEGRRARRQSELMEQQREKEREQQHEQQRRQNKQISQQYRGYGQGQGRNRGRCW